MSKRYPLYRNPVTYIGWYIAVAAFAIGVVLIVTDIFFFKGSPYNALVTYLIIPLILSAGIALALLGMLWEWRQRKRKGVEHHFPVVDLNKPKSQHRILTGILVLGVFFSVSAVGTYRAFTFTESTEFCGRLCHIVMNPEYTAYEHSPHARVPCVDCHIGTGAEWYVRSKISGLRQVYRTVTHTFKLPIKTPIRNLRPARATCEHCHWPRFFTGTIENVEWHFWDDEENTPSRYNMLLKVGGTRRDTDEAVGIHWHVSRRDTVRYWPKDPRRQEIPWIEVEFGDGSEKVFKTDGAPKGGPPEDEIRTMDCIDCHDRPSHIYRPAAQAVNQALSVGAIDRHLPSIKENSVKLLDADYKTKDEALQKIAAGLRDEYKTGSSGKIESASVEQAIETLSEIYRVNYFPEAGVSWKIYPNNIGHRHFPGCFRCHTEEHKTDKGESVPHNCDLCHEFVSQAVGKAAFEPVVYKAQPFQHPGEGMEDIWQGSLCTDCHGPQ